MCGHSQRCCVVWHVPEFLTVPLTRSVVLSGRERAAGARGHVSVPVHVPRMQRRAAPRSSVSAAATREVRTSSRAAPGMQQESIEHTQFNRSRSTQHVRRAFSTPPRGQCVCVCVCSGREGEREREKSLLCAVKLAILRQREMAGSSKLCPGLGSQHTLCA